MSDHAVFVLERIKLQALNELEQRTEKFLKDEFYNKWLPKTMKEVRGRIIIDMVNTNDFLDIQIKLNMEEK